jgi:PAS domain S-box-containing protein
MALLDLPTCLCAILRTLSDGLKRMADVRTLTVRPHQALPGSPQVLSSEAVLDALNMILTDAPLNEVLTSVARLIEAHSDRMLCSIFLVENDGLHLRYAAAPNLPETYRKATDGATIGTRGGPCSMAAYRRHAVFVADFLSDPELANFRDKPLSAGLLAGWSSPIISPDGKVLGTFGMYFREIRHPEPSEIRLIDYASRIAGIAIERERSRAALKLAFDDIKTSEGELRQTVDAIPQTIVVLGPDGSVVYANRTVHEYVGLSTEELMKNDFRERVFHPEDLARLRELRRGGFSGTVRWENELRIRGKTVSIDGFWSATIRFSTSVAT